MSKMMLDQLDNKLKAAHEKVATAKTGVANVLASLDQDDAAPREPSPEEAAQMQAAGAEIQAAEAQIKNWQAQRDLVADAMAAEATAATVLTSGDGNGLVGDGSLHGTGHVSEELPDRGFESVGHYAHAVYLDPSGRDQRLAPLAAATGMSQGVGADGGFLVPPAYSTAIWEGVTQQSDSLIQYCDPVDVPEGVDSMTFNANAETNRADGSRWGGVRGYWMGEAAQMTSSNPQLRQVKFEPHELYVFCYATNKLLRHAGSLGTWLQRTATDEIAFKMGDAIIEGDGIGKPTGIKGADCTLSVAKETADGGQGAATIVAANVQKMWMRLHPRSRANAIWLYNTDCEVQLQSMTLDVGTGGVPVFMPPGGLTQLPYSTIFGRPAIPCEYCETLGTAGDLVLADLSAYGLAVRQNVDASVSMHLRFDYNETCFKWIWEADGKPWLASALTPFKGTSNTLSTFVNIAVRA